LLLLLLVRLLTPGLATASYEEVLLVCGFVHGSAFRELLLGSFVCLAYLKRVIAEGKTLLGLLSEILVVRLGLLFCFGCHCVLIKLLTLCAWPVGEVGVGSASVWCEAGVFFRLCLGNRLSSLLIFPLGVAILSTPAVSSLLLVFAV
jgi:hypothetical protein